MAGKTKKSKTDVAARAGLRNSSRICSICGNAVEVVMAVSATGKKSMKRLCCAKAA